jgi:hypothetical protein
MLDVAGQLGREVRVIEVKVLCTLGSSKSLALTFTNHRLKISPNS